MNAPHPATANPFDCIARFDLERPEWLLERRAGIGASESPILFGEGYSGTSIYALWAEKSGMLPADDGEAAEFLLIGLDMEPSLRRIFTRKTGLETLSAPSLCIHAEHHHIIASLDGIAIDPDCGPCPLELKNVGEFAKGDWSDGQIPLKFQVQLQHQIFVTGAKCAYILGLVGGRKPEVRRVERSDRFIDNTLLPAIETFWRYVKTGTAPPVDGSEATSAVLKAIYAKHTPGEIAYLPAEFDELATEHLVAKAKVKEWAEKVDTIGNQVRAAMKEAEVAMLPDGRKYTYRTQDRKGYVVQPSSCRVLLGPK